MSIKIIPLAARKIKLRKISNAMLTKTINSPQQVVEGYGGRKVNQRVYSINNKKQLLRIVHEKEGKDIVVITACLTSQIRKYWRNQNEN